MAKRIRAFGNEAKVAFAETGTLPYLTRKHGPALVSLTTRATNLPTGVFPGADTERALAVIKEAYPCAHAVEDALSGALMNAGPIIHPPLIIMNSGPLNRSRDFDIHNEGTQPVVREVTNQLDAERIAIRTALGYVAPHYPLRDHYEGKDWMYGPASHTSVVQSGNWREPVDLLTHRYMREDVALGLAFLASVADWAGVRAPIAHGLLTIGSTICGEDFANGPRTWAGLGLQAMSKPEVKELLHHGYR
jgi:opine dehydrogenase